MPDVREFLDGMRSSPLVRAAFLAALILALQIPVLLIHGLVGERSARRAEAVAEVSGKWGGSQQVLGPFLVIPFRETVARLDERGRSWQTESQGVATFLAEELEILGRMDGAVRRRGIFDVPVYTLETSVRARFRVPELDALVAGAELEWERAQLVFEISDPRGIDRARAPRIAVAEAAFEPGVGRLAAQGRGIHLELGDGPVRKGLELSTELVLRGSRGVRFAPLARRTRVQLDGDWPDPSFQGAWLPGSRTVSDRGFESSWEIPHLGRDFPQAWTGPAPLERVRRSAFGVDLLSPVDAYRATDRSLKYQLLFLGLTFVVIWLVEVRTRVPVHPIQYALIGAAICLFYLLQLSLAEHLGLEIAYAAGSLAVGSLVFGYARAVLRSLRRALVVGGTVLGLYGYLYVLLQIEDYALLVGSVGLFAVLGLIMWTTRGVDWYAVGREPARGVDPA